MNCFCGMVDRRKAFSFISSRDNCQRSSSSRISNSPWVGYELAQNLSSGLVEWSCAVMTTTTPWITTAPLHQKQLIFYVRYWGVFCNSFINIIHIIWIEYLIKALESLKCFIPKSSRFLINNRYFAQYRSLAYNWILSISGCWFIRLNNDCNWNRTQDHLVRKRTLNHLAKLISRLLRARRFSTFRQL